jgi:hypothetical protein
MRGELKLQGVGLPTHFEHFVDTCLSKHSHRACGCGASRPVGPIMLSDRTARCQLAESAEPVAPQHPSPPVRLMLGAGRGTVSRPSASHKASTLSGDSPLASGILQVATQLDERINVQITEDMITDAVVMNDGSENLKITIHRASILHRRRGLRPPQHRTASRRKPHRHNTIGLGSHSQIDRGRPLPCSGGLGNVKNQQY